MSSTQSRETIDERREKKGEARLSEPVRLGEIVVQSYENIERRGQAIQNEQCKKRKAEKLAV